MATTKPLAIVVRDDFLGTFEAQKVMAERAMEQLNDDQLKQALDPETNSIAVIAKHVAGNLQSRWTDFLTSDGEKPWRDRDDEFVDLFADRTAMMTHWNVGWTALFNSLRWLSAEDLSATVLIRGEPHSVTLAASRSLAHTAYHVGQIVMIARILAGDDWQTLTIPRGGSKAFNDDQWEK